MLNPITRYLGHLEGFLTGNLPIASVQQIGSEVECHLRDLSEEFQTQGLEPERAEAAAVEQFGSAAKLAKGLLTNHLNKPGPAWAKWLQIVAFSSIWVFSVIQYSTGSKDVNLLIIGCLIAIALTVYGSIVAKKTQVTWLILSAVIGGTILVGQWAMTPKSLLTMTSQPSPASFEQLRLETQTSVKALLLVGGQLNLENNLVIKSLHTRFGPALKMDPTLSSYELPPVKNGLFFAPPSLTQFDHYLNFWSRTPTDFPLGKPVPISQAKLLWQAQLGGYSSSLHNQFVVWNQVTHRTQIRTTFATYFNAFIQLQFIALMIILMTYLIGLFANRKKSSGAVDRMLLG